MGAEIDGFLSFMSSDADVIVDTNFSNASALLELASYELAHVEVNGELDMSAGVMVALDWGQPSDKRVEVIDETGTRTGEYISFPTPALVSNVEKISSYMRFTDRDGNRYEVPISSAKVYFFVVSDLLE